MTSASSGPIALVTVTFNGRSVWQPFLACLCAQREVDWHLFVIDNASTDGLLDDLKALADPRITLISNDVNVGVAAANNQGITRAIEAGATRVVLINNDVEFGPELLSDLGAALNASGADAVSPLIPYFDAPDRIWYAGGSFRRRRGMMNVHDHFGEPVAMVGTSAFETAYAPTCCVMFNASVFATIGLMDERYFVYWDDTDFMWRMQAAGMRLIVAPAAVLYHKVSVSTGGRLSDFSIRFNFRNQIFFVRKHFGGALARYTALMAATAGVARVVASGDSPRHLVRRLQAIREGFAMPLA